MRPSIPRLIRIIPKTSLPSQKVKVVPELPSYEQAKKTPLIEILLKRKDEAGDNWPPNLRIEPPLSREKFKQVHHDVRVVLKDLLTEK
jgi:hypothetical protein